MLGISKTNDTNISRFERWIGEWLLIVGALVGILTFGYLAANWSVLWVYYIVDKGRNNDAWYHEGCD